MHLQVVVFIVVIVLVFLLTHIASVMIVSQVLGKRILIVEVVITELAVRMEEDDISFGIQISLLEMSFQLRESEESLLFEDQSSMLKADVAEVSVVLFLEMLLQDCKVAVSGMILALLDRALDLIKVINCLLHLLVLKEDSTLIFNLILANDVLILSILLIGEDNLKTSSIAKWALFISSFYSQFDNAKEAYSVVSAFKDTVHADFFVTKLTDKHNVSWWFI
jgi:hypothetical protein